MPTNSIILLIICIFMFVPLFLAEIARKKAVPTGLNFFLQDRKMKVFSMYATVFATWMSAFAFMGAIAYFYEEGPIYMTTIGWDALFALLFYFVGRRIWYYGKVNKYVTPTDFFNDIYGSKALNLLTTIISFTFTLLYLQLQLVGGLFLIQVGTNGGISWKVSGIIFFVVIIIYLWAGGLRAVALADTFYGILIIITILASGFFLMREAGGTEYVFNQIIMENPKDVTLVGHGRSALWLCLFLIVPIGAFMGPQMWIRNYAAKEEKNFELLPLLLCLSSIICIGTLFAGNAGLLLEKNPVQADTLIATLMLKYANPIFCTFIFLGIAAAIFSTANSQIHAMATMYTIDIHKKYINKNMTDRNQVKVAKWAVLIVSIVAYILLLIIPHSIFDMGTLALGGIAQLIVPVLGALFWKKSHKNGAIAGLLVGVAIMFLLIPVFNMEISYAAVCALIANGITFFVGALSSEKDIKTSEKIKTMRNSFKNQKI